MTAPTWQSHAACVGHDPDLWFPERGDTGVEAKRICVQCPVRLDCLADRLERGEDGGIWGGHGGDVARFLGRLWREQPTDGWGALVGFLRFAATVVVEGERLAVEADTGRAPAEGRPNRNGPGATHGRMSTYTRGCGCRACYLAMVIYTTDLRYREDAAA